MQTARKLTKHTVLIAHTAAMTLESVAWIAERVGETPASGGEVTEIKKETDQFITDYQE